jgi:heat-inducible transcriptional repressor
VPTEKGYRLYIDRMMKRIPMRRSDTRTVKSAMTGASDLEDLLERVTRSLRAVSHQAGVAVLPETGHGVIAAIRTSETGRRGLLVRLEVRPGGERTALLTFESDEERENISGLVGRIAADLIGSDTRQAANLLRRPSGRETGGSGKVAAAVRARLLDLVAPAPNRVHVNGAGNLVSAMDNTEQAGSLLEFLENRNTITRLLIPDEETSGISVSIGSENIYPPMRSCSIIRSTYEVGDGKGAIGIIGPLRMEYPRLMAIVEYASYQLTRLLAE